MQEQSLDLARRTALAALPWTAGFAVILTFTGIIPCCNFLVFPLGTLGLGYLTATRLGLYPTPEAKQSFALTIGAIATVAAVIASLITQGISLGFVALLGFAGGRSNFNLLTSGLGVGVSLVINLIVTIIGGLIFGAIFGVLGSYLALERQRRPEAYY